MKKLSKLHSRTAWRFISPTLIVLAAVVAFPLLFSFVVSFFRYTFITPKFDVFAGFDNYLFSFKDQYFWNSFKVTLIFVALVVPLEFLVGYGIALLLSRDIKFKTVFYFILTMPMVMSPVAVGLIWKMLLHPDLGIVNYLLQKMGFGYVNWFGDPRWALLAIVLIDIWQQVSFMILILLAGLTSLSKEPFESAKIDGAGPLQTLLYITTPMMLPVITVALLMRVIIAFKTYDLVYIITSGGPGVSTDIISYYIYRTTFMGLDLSQASAISFLLFVLTMAIVVVLFHQITKEKRR